MEQFLQKNKWSILAAGAAIQILTGIPAAWGVFQGPVRQEYGFDEGAASFIFSFTIGAFGLGCVIGGYLQDKAGRKRRGSFICASACRWGWDAPFYTRR